MRVLTVNSVAGLLAVLQEQVGSTPSHAVIHSWGQPEATAATAEEEVDKKVGQRRAGGAVDTFLDSESLDYSSSGFRYISLQ